MIAMSTRTIIEPTILKDKKSVDAFFDFLENAKPQKPVKVKGKLKKGDVKKANLSLK